MINFIIRRKNIFLAGLLILTVLTASRAAVSFDIAVIKLVQSFQADSFDYLSLFFTILGSGEVSGAIAVIFALFLFWRGSRRAAFYLLLFLGLSAVVEMAMKFSVPQPKVFSEFRRGLKPPIAIYSPFTPFAYPSGHAARSVILAVIFFYAAHLKISGEFRKKAAGAAVVILCILMLISRIYEGSHWPMDVFGGICLGAYLAALIMVQFQKDNF